VQTSAEQPPPDATAQQPAHAGKDGATGGHPFWVISREDLDKRPVRERCPAEVPNAATLGRWVNAIDLRLGDILFFRDGRHMPETNVSVRRAKMKVYNLPSGRTRELRSRAFGYS